MVSIICNTYNHEKYIRDALESFIFQKTNFEFEVLVHDDASTDNTTNIIREYEKRFPNMIKPIYQKQNQYSKGINIGQIYQYPRAKGKYVALCEGDDYWIDPLKLQKQVDYMEAHPECTLCFTNGYIEDQANDCEKRVFIPYCEKDKLVYQDICQKYTLNNMHEMTFVPTASYLYPKEAYNQIIPYLLGKCPTGDLRLRLFLTSIGYSYYIKDKTCIYRENVPNSSMTKWKSYNKKAIEEQCKQIINMISSLDEFTLKKYSEGINKIKAHYIRNLLFSANSITILKDKECKQIFISLALKDKIRFLIEVIIPENVTKSIKKFIRGYKVK